MALGVVCVLPSRVLRSQSSPGPNSQTLRAAAARVSPGDRIMMRIPREPELSDSVFVTENGDAAVPKLGLIKATSYSIAELRDTLVARYSEFLRAPSIQVVVLRRVVVNGEVRGPGVYMVDVNMTLRDLLARAGGVTETGKRSRVSIVRGTKTIAIPNWETDQSTGADLMSGDLVFVGRKSWLAINALPAISTAVVLGSFVLSLRK